MVIRMEKKAFYKLGANIRGLRKGYGETQLDLAMAIGVETTAISNYELGERVPERDVLLKIAKHYRITENELLHGNFANLKNMSKMPINDKEYNKVMFDKMLPLICTDKALENAKFKEAYDMHQEMYGLIIDGEEFDTDKIERCMDLYDAAREEGIIEGAANYLWWLFFFSFIFSFLTPKMLDNIAALKKKDATIKDIIHNGYLPSFDNEPTDKETQEFLEARKGFIEDNEVSMVVNIYRLKHTQEYQDLGDYYLALYYKFDIISNTLSPEMNSAVGDEMMLAFSLMGNSHADNFITSPNK